MEILHHQQNLQIYGIFVPGTKPFYNKEGKELFRIFELQFSYANKSVDNVPIRLPIVTEEMTPYSFISGELYFNKKKLRFEDVNMFRVLIPPEEHNWHLREFSFPFINGDNVSRELRINLRITGQCPGKCSFCHRIYSHRIKPIKKNILKPSLIFRKIEESEGSDVFSKINQVQIISELFGNENNFLRAVAETRYELDQRGYPSSMAFGCCAQDVRSYEGLMELLQHVRPARYSFSLECFRDRCQIMGPYKGLPIEEVLVILTNARKVGFKEIQLNYLAGIDSLDECNKGFKRLVDLNLVDSVGLSTYTCFSRDQQQIRHPTAWDPSYYLSVVGILKSFGIKKYRAESYNMGCPYSKMMEPFNNEIP